MCPRKRKRNTWLIDKMPVMRSSGEAIRIVLTNGTSGWNASGAKLWATRQNDIANPMEAGRAAGQAPSGRGIMATRKNMNGSHRAVIGKDDLTIGNGPTTAVSSRNGHIRCRFQSLAEAVT